ncbi:MAG TPA: ABC transporter permease [Acidobacteriota bacterium]|nr:ABC transporter permease [Acidobacteriota bacterium]
MTNFLQDLRFAFRLLTKNPGFSAVALLTLAIGIGANSAIFSLTDQILLKPLPIENPDRLVVLRSPGPKRGLVWSDGDSSASFSYPLYRRLAERSPHVAQLMGRFQIPLSVAFQGQAERAEGALVSGNFFQALEINPVAGRLFAPSDDVNTGAHPLAVLSHGYWKRRFDSSQDIINQTILVNDHSLTVIGVAGEGFQGVQVGQSIDLWIPLAMKPQMTPNQDWTEEWNAYWLAIVGKLEEGMPAEKAQAALTSIYRPLLEEQLSVMSSPYSGEAKDRFLQKPLEVISAPNGRPIIQRSTETPLLLLNGIVALVLLIACANVANLLVARGITRRREIALRLALGGSRGRLMRQLLVESLLLALGGAGLGLLLAWWTSQSLISALSENLGLEGLSGSLNWRLLGFTAAVAIFTGLLFGLLPALRSSRTDLASSLKEQVGKGSSSKSHLRFRKVLVTAQIALTLGLLLTAGLLARSFYNLRTTDLGLNPEQVLQFSVAPELNGYDPPRTAEFVDRTRRSISGLPGVVAASAAVIPVLADSTSASNITVEDYQPQEEEDMNVVQNWVTPDFFTVMGLRLLSGRPIEERDGGESPKVAVINETMARRYFEDGQAVGRRFAFGAGDRIVPDIEIVGVVNDSKHTSVDEEERPLVYLPATQFEHLGSLTFYVRTAGDPAQLAPVLRNQVREIDPNLPIYRVRTFETQIAQSTSTQQMLMVLSGSFGAIAALLAAIGLSGVMAYNVARRTREIGIRMALGAHRGDVLWMVLREVGVLTLIGVAIGLPGAYGLSLLAESVMFQVQPGDPLLMILAVLLMGSVALLSGFLPARRASRVNPVVALRTE